MWDYWLLHSWTYSSMQVAGWQHHRSFLWVCICAPQYHQLLGLVAPHWTMEEIFHCYNTGLHTAARVSVEQVIKNPAPPVCWIAWFTVVVISNKWRWECIIIVMTRVDARAILPNGICVSWTNSSNSSTVASVCIKLKKVYWYFLHCSLLSHLALPICLYNIIDVVKKMLWTYHKQPLPR